MLVYNLLYMSFVLNYSEIQFKVFTRTPFVIAMTAVHDKKLPDKKSPDYSVNLQVYTKCLPFVSINSAYIDNVKSMKSMPQ